PRAGPRRRASSADLPTSQGRVLSRRWKAHLRARLPGGRGMSPTVTIAGRPIGPGQPCYIVAELSANHHQRFDKAVELVRAAKTAGADAVKLQTYTPDTLTIDCDAPHFVIGGGTLWEGRKLYELYGEACTPWEWHGPLLELAASLGMAGFSSPFDATAVDFL